MLGKAGFGQSFSREVKNSYRDTKSAVFIRCFIVSKGVTFLKTSQWVWIRQQDFEERPGRVISEWEVYLGLCVPAI